jgi:hypothetical protein
MKRLLGLAACLVSILGAFAAEAPASFKVGEFAFERPEKWTWVETASSMRKAQLKVESSDGKESGEAVFFHFGAGDGGGAKANVERWLGQFSEKGDKLDSKVEETTVRGRKITFVRAVGTYQSGMPGGPKTPLTDHMLLGAIVDSSAGSVFVRFTAPKSLGTASEVTFRKMIEGAIP